MPGCELSTGLTKVGTDSVQLLSENGALIDSILLRTSFYLGTEEHSFSQDQGAEPVAGTLSDTNRTLNPSIAKLAVFVNY